MSKIVEGLLYSDSHEWVKVDGDVAIIGVTDYAQAEMGDITYVDLPEVDDEVSQGEDFGALESVKASSELYSPVSGTVIAVNEALEDAPELVNEALEDAPELVNEDAFANWIIKVQMSDKAELESLMDAAAYAGITE